MKKLIIITLFVVFGLIGPTSVHAAPAFVQSTSTPSISGVSQRTLPSISTTAGDLLVACVQAQKSTVVTMGDSQGNTWTLATTSVVGTGPVTLSVFYTANIPGGSMSASSTESGAAAVSRLFVHEYSGMALASPLDAFIASSTTVANVLINSGKLTTQGLQEVMFQCSGQSVVPTFTAGNGFTGRETSGGRGWTQDLIAASTTPTGFATLSTGQNWNTIMVAFLPFVPPPPPANIQVSGKNGRVIISGKNGRVSIK